jgi:DNA-damage-inducible protein J
MATAKSTINIEIDSDIKERALQLFASIGLDQTAAIDMFFRRVIAEQRLPFQPVTSPTLDDQLIEALESTPAKEYTLD